MKGLVKRGLISFHYVVVEWWVIMAVLVIMVIKIRSCYGMAVLV